MAQLAPPRTQRTPALQPLIALLDALVREPFPTPYPGQGYWDYKIPVHQGAVDGPRASHAFRQTCVEMLLLGCTILRTRKPTSASFVRVVAVVTLPELFASNLTVFFDESYHQEFFLRSRSWQTWTPLPPGRSLLREWAIPKHFTLPERGYRETIDGDDYHHEGEIWFYGDV